MTTTGNLAALAEYEPRQLISDLFHQLSQPLTTLRCSLELALLQTLTTEQYREAVGQALGQAEKASWSATAIRELLDAGQVGPDLEVLELRKAVADAVSDLLPVAESAGVRIGYLPGSACPVWFDAQRLRQGLFHLLGFVVSSVGPGAGVKIDLDERGKEAVLALTASGQRACDEASADSDPELSRRLGLGIARTIFEVAGGNFSVEREGQSLSVEVRLPRNGGQ